MRLVTVSGTLLASFSPACNHVERLAWAALACVLGSALLWASAKVQVPFLPVPMTMQTYVVMVLSAACGWRLGAATVLVYLAEGALGLPVFAGTPEKGIGLAYMAGPTGGYLVGFLVAAVVTGRLAELGWSRTWWLTVAAMALGHGVIFLFGVGWLTVLVGFDRAVDVGLTPFIAATFLKTALAGATMPLAWRLLARP